MNASILWLGDPGCDDASLVGGKVANLSRLAGSRRVPPGFCIPAHAPVTAQDLAAAYARLAERCGIAEPAVAVRSSAADEDSSGASFAGQHETFLNVRGVDELIRAVQLCRDSLHSARALAYRHERGLSMEDARLAVLVQQLVPADACGVVFSANPMSGSREEAVVTSSWGLGESVVGGTVSPDTYIVRKAAQDIVLRQIGPKLRMTVPVPVGTREVDVPAIQQTQAAISDAHCLDAVRLAQSLEVEMGWPVDIECAWSSGVLYLLQCRPITTLPSHERTR